MNAPHSFSDSGAPAHFLGFLAQAFRYLKARAALAALEAKGAGVQYGVAAGLILGALFIAVLGYVFLIVTAVFAVGLAFDDKHAWVAILGVAALLHLGGASLLVVFARRKLGGAAFPETLAELERDRAWLHQLTK